ncbi:MAG: DUF6484 domain-containing protein [Pirellulaceae bacterium]
MHLEKQTDAAFATRVLASRATTVGRIVEIDKDGRAFVDFPGNVGGRVLARSLVSIVEDKTFDPTNLPAVLLIFADGDSRPIIAGLIRDEVVGTKADSQKPSGLSSSKEGVEIRCGRSSIQLRSDGRILISGTSITSHARQRNRIKGGSVAIN